VAITLTELQSKVMDYLISRRSPADAAAVSKKFIISKSKASITLFQLHEIGLTDVVPMGNKKFYKVKE
jgi:predicted transcriptional regulator